MDGRFVVDPDEVDSRCVCKQLFSSVERDLCIIVFFFQGRYLFIIVPFVFARSEYFISKERREYIQHLLRCCSSRDIYSFLSLSFFLNNLNNRINKCLLFDVNCETVGRGCNKNSQLLYNMNIYIYILDNLVFKFFADNVSDAWIKA